MACTPALACKALLSQATARWPRRSRASDGICPSPTHSSQNPSSDHELGNAGDLTHDPAHGCDAHRWARLLADRRDRRIKYIISNGQIWNPLIAARAVYTALRAEGAGILRSARAATPGWRTYTGSNPHRTHAHVSIHAAYRNDTSPWFIDLPPAPPTPSPPHPDAPLEVDVQIRSEHIEMPLDDKGRGNVTVPFPIDRIIGFLPHSEVRPNVDGRYDEPANSVTFTPEGTGTVVVVQGGTPLGRAHVWLRVAA